MDYLYENEKACKILNSVQYENFKVDLHKYGLNETNMCEYITTRLDKHLSKH